MAVLDVLLDLLTSCDLWWIWQAVYQVRPGSSIDIFKEASQAGVPTATSMRFCNVRTKLPCCGGFCKKSHGASDLEIFVQFYFLFDGLTVDHVSSSWTSVWTRT